MARPKKPTIEELNNQIINLTEALQRERADVINVRRRHDEQIIGLKSHIKADVVEMLLPVIDNFERALGHVPKDLESNDFVKGVQAIVKQFEKTLGDIGVERIETIGKEFNPQLHEAVSMEDNGGQKEIVCDEVQPGYRIGNTIIRHAKVKVKTERKED